MIDIEIGQRFVLDDGDIWEFQGKTYVNAWMDHYQVLWIGEDLLEAYEPDELMGMLRKSQKL